MALEQLFPLAAIDVVDAHVGADDASYDSCISVRVTGQESCLQHSPVVRLVDRLLCAAHKSVHGEDKSVFHKAHIFLRVVGVDTEVLLGLSCLLVCDFIDDSLSFGE